MKSALYRFEPTSSKITSSAIRALIKMVGSEVEYWEILPNKRLDGNAYGEYSGKDIRVEEFKPPVQLNLLIVNVGVDFLQVSDFDLGTPNEVFCYVENEVILQPESRLYINRPKDGIKVCYRVEDEENIGTVVSGIRRYRLNLFEE